MRDMASQMKIPYGIRDFERISSEGCYCVDEKGNFGKLFGGLGVCTASAAGAWHGQLPRRHFHQSFALRRKAARL